jgi:diguanylate cyclase (GGDEF)-like protein
MTSGSAPSARAGDQVALSRAAARRMAFRHDLGFAIAARADECVRRTEARLHTLRWAGPPNKPYLEQRPAVIWFSTLLVARWLATDVDPSEGELGWISERGRSAAEGQVSIINIVRANLVWRDTLIVIAREEGKRLHTPRVVVDSVIDVVRYNCDSGIIRTVGVFDAHMAEVAQQLAAERATLRYQALHDALTGVANRSLLLKTLRATLQQLGTGVCAVLILDLDDFKRVNDDFGHDAGDALLVHVCRRLQAAIRSTDTLARLGGDELCIVLAKVANLEEARIAATRIAQVFCHPFNLSGGRRTSMSASIGLATATADDTASAVLRRADAAMYRAKASGKACVAVDGDAG